MIQDFETFKAELSLSKEEICRELYQENTDKIRIKKETTATRNLARIIDSTLRLANSKGFHAMTLRDLCSDSGLSMGGLYAYIRNKDDLIHLIQSHGFKLTRRTVLQYIADIRDPVEKLSQAIRAHVFLSELIRPWFYFSYMEAKSLPPVEKQNAVATEREIETIFCNIISEGIEQGVFRQINARLLSSLIKAMMQDWYLKRRKYREQGVSVEDFANQIRDLLQAYLLPVASGKLAVSHKATSSAT
ncbi:TetR/AcrR family transcriptional regulator [Marinobacter segnicrescens]|uniref:Transcriptional regulator, TetR family n=1 Tax=Marinobacter segnicrescens TaxID=430453 RepID=A0A1I0DKG5_9GAMM|nr:TetR/AcrR family transcriptional regulator [Marinobacter segnicrescens]SET32566.1 transcriptional regulator, TetR family [Marinobacter segnicrescens]